MAIPNTPNGTAQPAQQPTPDLPGFSPEALAGLVQQSVQAVIDNERSKSQALARQQADEARRQAEAAAQAGDLTKNPVFQTVAPVIAPAMQAVALKADNAIDMSNFYAQYPEANKYRSELEAMTQGEIQRGRPTSRESLWFHFRGNPANQARLQADYDAQQKMLAQMTATVGPGGVGRGDAVGPTFTPDTPVQAMRDALKGVSF